MESREFRAIDPVGKVPTLRHGSVVVTECAATCDCLAAAFPACALAPEPDRPERGSYDRRLFFGAGRWKPPPTTTCGSKSRTTGASWP